ncbi:MAG: hypothetical protein FWC61_02385 [Proteobacteria bacterium]|nr:hypothetical protein [Pseudomonadota bacterium]
MAGAGGSCWWLVIGIDEIKFITYSFYQPPARTTSTNHQHQPPTPTTSTSHHSTF